MNSILPEDAWCFNGSGCWVLLVSHFLCFSVTSLIAVYVTSWTINGFSERTDDVIITTSLHVSVLANSQRQRLLTRDQLNHLSLLKLRSLLLNGLIVVMAVHQFGLKQTHRVYSHSLFSLTIQAQRCSCRKHSPILSCGLHANAWDESCILIFEFGVLAAHLLQHFTNSKRDSLKSCSWDLANKSSVPQSHICSVRAFTEALPPPTTAEVNYLTDVSNSFILNV